MKMRSWLAMLCLPSAVLAQREPLRQPTAVPTELAVALATAGGLGFASEPLILVGEVPDWMASRIHVPAGALVLGSAYAGNTALAVVQTLQLEGDSMPGLEAELARKGWRRPVTTMTSGGFRFLDDSRTSMPFPQVLCSENRTLSVIRGTARQGKQTWYFRLQDARAGYGPCNIPAAYASRRAEFPVLYHPAGAEREMPPRFECSSLDASDPRRGPGSGTSAYLRSAMSPDSLLAHYGRRLADSGWMAMQERTSSVARFWTRTDTAGKASVIRLTVNASSENVACRDVNLMRYPREP